MYQAVSDNLHFFMISSQNFDVMRKSKLLIICPPIFKLDYGLGFFLIMKIE